MKSSIDEFNVVLDDPSYVFSPGQHVNGKVLFKTKQPVKISKLWLECLGEAYVSWPEHSGTYTRYRHCKEEYFHLKSCIYDQATTNQDVCNDYAFSFRVTIPYQDLPPSYESVHGYIRYSISAQIKCNNKKTKHKTKKTCFVVGNYEEFDEQELEDIKDDEQKLQNGKDQTVATLSKQSQSVGTAKLSAHTDKILYQGGDIIKTKIHIEYQQEMEKIRASLIRVTKYTDSYGQSTYHTDDIVSVDKELTQCPKELDTELAVPHAAYPTMQLGCKCINVSYHIEVRLRPKNKRLKESNVKIPIIILSTPGTATSSTRTPNTTTPSTTTSTTPSTTSSNTTCSEITKEHNSPRKKTRGALFCVIGRPVGSSENLLRNDSYVRRSTHEDGEYGISNLSRQWSNVSLV